MLIQHDLGELMHGSDNQEFLDLLESEPTKICQMYESYCFKITNQIDLKYVLPKHGTKNK